MMLLSILSVAFAAFCVWLIVRLVNRRERWAKWTLASVVGLPVLYVASFGPACWFTSRAHVGYFKLPTIYGPILFTLSDKGFVGTVVRWYTEVGAHPGRQWVDISDSAGPFWMWLGP